MAVSDQFYFDLLVDVDPLFEEFGTQYTVYTPGVYDPDSLSTGPATTRQVFGLVADQHVVATVSRGAATVGDPNPAYIGLKNLILRRDANPVTGEEVEVDGKRFSLDKLEPIKPAEIVVIYILDISR